MPSLRPVCIGVGLIAFVLHLVGLSSKYWWYGHYDNHDVIMGLWESCIDGSCVSIVGKAPHDSRLDAARVMSVLALTFGAVAIGIYIANLWWRKVVLSKISLAAVCISPACILVALLSWTFYIPSELREAQYFSWSFGLCAGAMCLFVVDVPLMARQLWVDCKREDYLPA